MKMYVQNMPQVWASTASLAASGSATSGSFLCHGYSRLVGMLYTSTSAKSGSGLRISQSCDGGANFDYHTNYAPAATTGCAFSIELVGDAAKITYITDGAASVFRTAWRLRPV